MALRYFSCIPCGPVCAYTRKLDQALSEVPRRGTPHAGLIGTGRRRKGEGRGLVAVLVREALENEGAGGKLRKDLWEQPRGRKAQGRG